MKKLILFSLLILPTLSVRAQAPILVTPQWLNDHLNDPAVVVLQVSYLQFEYDREHIPGSQFLWPEWLAPNSPKGNFNAPDVKQTTTLLESLGISNNSHIVICHTSNQVSVAARMFLTLEYLGLRSHVSFLNGGLDAWKQSGFTVTKEPSSVKKGKLTLTPDQTIVDKDYVLKNLTSASAIIVDARMQKYYDGEPTGNPRDGHITNAKNIPYTEMVDATNLFKPVDQLQAYFTPVSADKRKELVTYCFIGQTASVVYIAGRILGYNMKLYDGSLQEWSRIDELPMEMTKK